MDEEQGYCYTLSQSFNWLHYQSTGSTDLWDKIIIDHEYIYLQCLKKNAENNILNPRYRVSIMCIYPTNN